MRKTLDELSRYDKFIYDNFMVNYNDDSIAIDYAYEIVGLKKFNHHLVLPCSNKKIDKEYVEKLAFNIGLLEMISYWKATISKNVFINCGLINKEQEEFFRKIFYYGLGEFFYVNELNPDYVVIIGEDEAKGNYVTVKDNLTKENKKVKFDELVEYFSMI